MPFPEIASEVFLARNTIKSQASSICRTLGAGSRGQGGSPGSAGWACWTADVLALMTLSVNKNMIDRDEYPQTAEIERRSVHMMADLWNAPEAANTRRPRPPSTGRNRGSWPRFASDARRPATHLG